MQPVSRSAHPKSFPAVFKDGSYFIIYKTMRIFWIIQVTGKSSVVPIEAIKATFVIEFPFPIKTGTNPKYTPVVFINCPDCITAQTSRIPRYIPVMQKLPCFFVKAVQPIMRPNPKYPLVIP
jgi:hypothetical protein